jgi:uncharacterized protein YbbK (DUF523 family)
MPALGACTPSLLWNFVRRYQEKNNMIIVSACLADLRCRYDGDAKPCEAVMRLVAEGRAIPVCPEQLGGLPTPRLPAEQCGDKVIRQDGVDVSGKFHRGALEALKLAQLAGGGTAILKARSPSCGSGIIYDGSFTGTLIPGNGIFAQLCRNNGIEVKTEEEFTSTPPPEARSA